MTVISEPLSNIAGAEPDRPLPFRAPRYRARADESGIVSNVSQFVDVVDGVFSVELDPGPAEVQLGGEWIPFIVPDVAESALWPLIEDGVENYQPPTVSLVKSYRDEARAARDTALTAAAGVADIAADVEKVAEDKTAAEAARDAASRSASGAAGSATAAGTSASAAATARGGAESARDAAVTAKGAAESAASTASGRATAAASSASAAAGSATAAATSATNAGNSATAAGTARADAQGFRNQAETFAQRAAEAATGGIPDRSLGPSKFTPQVVSALERAGTAVQEGDGRLSDARQALPHTHPLSEVVGFQEAANNLEAQVALKADATALKGKADLDGNGKVLASQVPAIALTDFLGEVGSQAAMLALTGQRGDWCNRTDKGTEWQLIAEPSTALASWREKIYPASPVQSVAGRAGAVTLSKADVGLQSVDNTADSAKPVSSAQASAIAAARDTRVANAAGQSLTLWAGTEAEYNALAAAVRNAAGFVAVIR